MQRAISARCAHPRAAAEVSVIDICRRAGVKCYLLKPFNPDYAVSVFRRVLNYTRGIPLPRFDKARRCTGSAGRCEHPGTQCSAQSGDMQQARIRAPAPCGRIFFALRRAPPAVVSPSSM